LNNNEIGSEFWEIEKGTECGFPEGERSFSFLLSGRTSLDFIIQDIRKERPFDSVYLPSYCCRTMIRPFLDNGVAVKFYRVSFSEGRFTYDIDPSVPCDALLVMQYFGFCTKDVENIILRFNEMRKTVVEDATHSWFSGTPYSPSSDYVLASFRKWTGIPAGSAAIKRNGEFHLPPPSKTNERYIEMRIRAAALKKQFISDQEGRKERFLDLFNQAEELLEHDYRNYSLPEELAEQIAALDCRMIAGVRRANAAVLVEGLKDCASLELPLLQKEDAPLFVPVFLREQHRREGLRKHLIENRVYCPVHWPLSDVHPRSEDSLYGSELSLICDQRYSRREMERVAELVRGFLEG